MLESILSVSRRTHYTSGRCYTVHLFTWTITICSAEGQYTTGGPFAVVMPTRYVRTPRVLRVQANSSA